MYGESKNSQKWNLWETSDKIRTKDKLTWHGWWVSAINRPPTCMGEEGWYAKEVYGGLCLWTCCKANPLRHWSQGLLDSHGQPSNSLHYKGIFNGSEKFVILSQRID